jgi:beta-phosphoglucomutase-like phosphatase (HAD superfamily)
VILTRNPIHVTTRPTETRRTSKTLSPTRAHALSEYVTHAVPLSYPVSVESLRSSWQTALDAAEDALRAAGFCLPAEELRARSTDLVAERNPTEELLQGLARDRHQDAEFVRLMPRTDARLLLGLPPVVAACVFNLDGVLIGSAAIHAAAWSETFDEFISRRIEETGGHFPPFNPREDYRAHVHGKPRLEGVRAFLASRGVSLPEGSPDDPPGAETVHGLANRKNEALRRRLDQYGVRAFAGATRYLEIARDAHVPYAIVSASANTGAILERAGLAGLIEHSVDGNTALAQGLRPRPAPDALLAACRMLGAETRRTAVFETSPAGIAAALEGGFGFVVGVDAGGQAAALRAQGADLVITGLSELLDRRAAP